MCFSYSSLLGIDNDDPLPPPKKAAESLKNSAYQALKTWHEVYSSGYRKLELAYNYLRTCHQVDFARADHMSALQRHQEREAQLQAEAKRQKRIANITASIDGTFYLLYVAFFRQGGTEELVSIFNFYVHSTDLVDLQTCVPSYEC